MDFWGVTPIRILGSENMFWLKYKYRNTYNQTYNQEYTHSQTNELSMQPK